MEILAMLSLVWKSKPSPGERLLYNCLILTRSKRIQTMEDGSCGANFDKVETVFRCSWILYIGLKMLWLSLVRSTSSMC